MNESVKVREGSKENKYRVIFNTSHEERYAGARKAILADR